MEQSRHNLPSTLTTQTPTLTQNERAMNPTNSAQVAGSGVGTQPIQQPAANVVAAGADPNLPPLPINTKKRKPNASGPRKTSAAWEHFIKLPENEAKDPTAACKYCNKKYLCDSKQHGTSNLLAHLKICPKYPSAVTNDPKQTILTFPRGEGGNIVAASQRFNVEACRKALAMFVTLDEQPFKVAEGEGFKYLCKQLQPQFTIPSRYTVAKDCFKLYLDEKVRLKALFKSDCCRVALTTDCWTSIQNLSYLTLTAHFIDNDWKYQKRIISFSTVANHKGETIGKKVDEVLKEWGIKNVSTITVDNASSNDVAVAYLKKRLRIMNGLVLDGQFLHMRCCAHILNLVVNDGLKDMNTSITSIRNAVRFVRSSPQRLAKFKECIEFSGVKCKKLVCLDVPTRWNSTYLMLDAAENYQVAFEKLVDVEDTYVDFFGADGPPTREDWENARAFVKFLKIFYDATRVLSTSVHVSIQSAFHQLAAVYCELRGAAMNLNTIYATMGLEMRKKYDKYWGNILNINQLLYFGVILDPRYKLKYVEWSFEDMYRDQPVFANDLFKSLKNNLSKMYNWYKTALDQQSRQSSHDPVEGFPQGGTSILAENPSYVARANAFKQHLKEQNSIDQKNELERYLTESCIDGDDKFDLLLWWKNNSSRYPILSSFAKDVLATPVSTVASESAFSTGGRVIDTFRSSLNPEMAEALICAQNWLRPSLYHLKDLKINEEFEISEKIVTEFGATVADRVAGSSTTGVAGPSQSQPMNIGCE